MVDNPTVPVPTEQPKAGSYRARLVDRRYASDTWEVVEPGKPWDGYRFNLPTLPIFTEIEVVAIVIDGKTEVQARYSNSKR